MWRLHILDIMLFIPEIVFLSSMKSANNVEAACKGHPIRRKHKKKNICNIRDNELALGN